MARLSKSMEEMLETAYKNCAPKKPELNRLDLFSIGFYQGFKGAFLQHNDSIFGEGFNMTGKTEWIDTDFKKDYVREAVKNIPHNCQGVDIGFSYSGLGYMAGNIMANPVVLITTLSAITYYFSR